MNFNLIWYEECENNFQKNVSYILITSFVFCFYAFECVFISVTASKDETMFKEK